MKTILIILMLFFSSFAAADVCFDGPTAGRMVVELEGCRIDQAETIPVMQEMLSNCSGQVTNCENEISVCKDALNKQETITELVKPTIWDRIQQYGEDALITIVIICGVILLAH